MEMIAPIWPAGRCSDSGVQMANGIPNGPQSGHRPTGERLQVAILGGGTAGWMAACLMAKTWPAARITLIESPEIRIVGVGEGSTPQLAAFFAALGIADADWMPRANATYKTGIRFRGWSDVAGYQAYFHPFSTQIDVHSEPSFHANARARRSGIDVPAHPDAFFLNSRLAATARAPLPADNFPFAVHHGYHFDAHLVGDVLRDQATGRGVVHRQARVTGATLAEDGGIAELITDRGDPVAADLFVDASGFRGTLIQQALGVPFRSFADNLFTDRAVVMPTPPGVEGPAVHTTATALSNGWAWDIPLTGRTGNGYVYSSAHLSPEDAERELRTHLGVGDAGDARHLTMKVGRVERSWAYNCLAIGLAQGFLEPLEATALHIVQATVEGFVHAFTAGGFTSVNRDAFNKGIAERYDGIRDYIVAHYRLARRRDTGFWRDNAGHDRLSDSLKAVMTCWFTGGDLVAEVDRLDIAGYYSALSWGCLLAGYGRFPDAKRLRAGPSPADMAAIDRFLAGCAANFPTHRQALATLGATAATR